MFLRFSFLLLSFVFVASCTNTEGDTWTKDRDALIGTWNGKVTFVKTNTSTNTETTGERNVKIRFFNYEDAIVTHLLAPGLENSFDCRWTYQAEPEKITISPIRAFVFNFPNSFDIIKKTKDTQTWKGKYKEYIINPGTNKQDIEISETWEMTKP
jgi:hypothetical protein